MGGAHVTSIEIPFHSAILEKLLLRRSGSKGTLGKGQSAKTEMNKAVLSRTVKYFVDVFGPCSQLGKQVPPKRLESG